LDAAPDPGALAVGGGGRLRGRFLGLSAADRDLATDVNDAGRRCGHFVATFATLVAIFTFRGVLHIEKP